MPGIVVDAKEVTARLAIRVLILHLAQRVLVCEDSSLQVVHESLVAPQVIS